MDIEELNERFNLASLKPKVEKGFGFMVLIGPDSYSDWRRWTERNDPNEQQSTYTTIQRNGHGSFGGELHAILFKGRTVAEAFLQTADFAHKETGVLHFKREPLPPPARGW